MSLNKKWIILPVIFLLSLLTSCKPTQTQLDKHATQIAADVFATLTAQPPTPTQTAIPMATFIPAPTFVPTATLPPAVNGWRAYDYPDFSIKAPEQWKLIYTGEGQVDDVLKSLKISKDDLDQAAESLISQMTNNENEHDAFRLIAFDPYHFDSSKSSFLIEKYPLDGEYTLSELCNKYLEKSKPEKANAPEINCHDHVNKNTAFYFNLETIYQSQDVHDVLYFVLDGEWVWLVEYIVEAPADKDGIPVFKEIAQTFTIR
jgi:hypothetical protein